MIRKLQRQRNILTQQVSDLAKFNYAREPEFVRDRNKLRATLDSVELLKRRIASECMLRILPRLRKIHDQLADAARRLEEESDALKDEFLKGKFPNDQKGYDEFIEQYIRSRKEYHRLRILKDKSGNTTHLEAYIPKPTTSASSDNSPIPPMRQRKRISLSR